MECPKCGSTKLEKLPPSKISPHPGYSCGECQQIMRAPGMLLVYLFILVLGAGLGTLFLYLLLSEERFSVKGLWLGVISLVCAGYSLMQLRLPVPRRNSSPDDE